MKASEVLEKAAAEVLKPDGWCQYSYGAFHQPEGAVCATGAIQRVVESSQDLSIMVAVAEGSRNAWSELTDHLGMFPSEYNDTPGRTAQEVADAMLECAKDLKERGL